MSENKKQRAVDELRLCSESFERKGEKAGWDLAKKQSLANAGGYLNAETQIRWLSYLSAWLEVNFKRTPERHILEVCDKDGKRIKEGDIVIGYREWASGDGRLPKNTPERVRVRLEVVWDRMTGSYALKELGYHPEDEVHGQARNYRRYDYRLEVSPRRAASTNCHLGGTFRKDMVCEKLELYEAASSESTVPAA